MNTDGLSGGDEPDAAGAGDSTTGADASGDADAAGAADSSSPDGGGESDDSTAPGDDAFDAGAGDGDAESADSASTDSTAPSDAGDEDAATPDAFVADGTEPETGDDASNDADAGMNDATVDSAPPDSGMSDASADVVGQDSSVDAGPPVALPRTGWVATAFSSLGSNPPSYAIDGSGTTRWSPGVGQAAGQWFQVDMAAVHAFREITIDAGASWAVDYTRGVQVIVSNDGSSWSSPVAVGAGTSQLLTIDFATVSARYVRIVLTGVPPTTHWWSIAELNVLD